MIKNKKVIMCLLVGTMFFSTIILAFPVGASSPTIHVYTGQSIQAAVTSAAAGSTIVVHEGIYDEYVGIGKPLTLKGIRATIQQIDGWSAVTLGSGGISLSGFTIKAGAVAVDAGGYCSKSIITDNEIYAYAQNGVGVGINRASNLVISNNVIHAVYPIYGYQQTSNIIIRNNALYADVNDGSMGILMLYWFENPTIYKNVVITGNSIYAKRQGIAIFRCEGAVISGNKIKADWGGISVLGTRSLVCNNKVTGNFWAGIYIDSIWATENDYYSSQNAVLSNSVVGNNVPNSYGILLVEYTNENLVALNKVSGVETNILDKGINNIVIYN